MADPPKRRGWFIVEKVLSVKTTVFQFAPALHLGGLSLFQRIAAAVIVAASIGTTAGIIASEVTEPPAVVITVTPEGELINVVPASGSVFDEILEAIANRDAELLQALTNIGGVLELHTVQHNAILAAIAGIEFDPPPVDPPGLTADQAAAILEQLDTIEGAIFPGRGECPDCPESVTE